MMLSLFILFSWVKILSTISSAFLAYRIARKEMTPTRTYMLFAASYVLLFCLIIYNFQNALGVDAFLDSENPNETLLANMASSLPFMLQLLAFIFKYSAISITGDKK